MKSFLNSRNGALLFLLFFSDSAVAQNYRLSAEVAVSEGQPRLASELAPNSDIPIIAISADKVSGFSGSTVAAQKQFDDSHLKLRYSARGSFYARLLAASDESEQRTVRVEVYSAAHRQLYAVQRKQHGDDSLPNFVVSEENGTLILGQNYDGRLFFYDNKGKLKSEVVLFEEAEYDLERTLDFACDESGSRLAVVASKRGASPRDSSAPNPSGEPALFLFSENGKMLWGKALTEDSAALLGISNQGDKIAVASFSIAADGGLRKTCLVFENGTEVFDMDFLPKHAAFSDDGASLLLLNNQAARLVDLGQKVVLWEKDETAGAGMFVAGKLSNGATSILLKAESQLRDHGFVFVAPELEVLNESGKSIQTIPLDGKEFAEPSLGFSPSGNTIFLGFTGSYQIYKASE